MQNLLRKYVPPSDRFAEILCGLIMLLTFTLAGGVMEASPDELVLGAVSCALAWGVIDGAIFMLNSLFQRGRQEKLVAEIRSLDRATAIARLREGFDHKYSEVISPEMREEIYHDIVDVARETEPHRPWFTREEVYGGLGLLAIEAICSIPAILPLIILEDDLRALRFSNALLLATMAVIGYYWAGWSGWQGAMRLVIAGFVLALGLVMVGVAILMGG
ncbi:MAG: hypothetical protein IPM83_01410 [Ignavibacteria bacterium]|nr:hypothetical protein [Ignavibacteria bacterium]